MVKIYKIAIIISNNKSVQTEENTSKLNVLYNVIVKYDHIDRETLI